MLVQPAISSDRQSSRAGPPGIRFRGTKAITALSDQNSYVERPFRRGSPPATFLTPASSNARSTQLPEAVGAAMLVMVLSAAGQARLRTMADPLDA